VGDPFYGKKAEEKHTLESQTHQRMELHAVSVSFRQPFTGEEILVEAPFRCAFFLPVLE